ncbi:MAG: phosphate signaling complex protein PhoU [Firmicutes bacterium]|nr:phosphate signaling complex protein PhoU [Bacillota bacterium]
MRNHFDMQLEQLNESLTKMGELCDEAMNLAAAALKGNDTAKAEEVISADYKIDQMEKEIESICLKLLLQQQPVARDLRQISAALKMITDMERIGDQTADIAEIIKHLGDRNGPEHDAIETMARAAAKMVTTSVEAFVRRDVALAEKVVSDDDSVDNYFEEIRDGLIEMIVRDTEDGRYALDLLMIAKYIERIGDHAVNIAEWVVFAVTGEHN